MDIEADLVKRERSADEHAKAYVYEELILEEPYMHYWDDVTTIEMGQDGFISSVQEAYDRAYSRYEKRDKFKHQGQQQKDKSSLLSKKDPEALKSRFKAKSKAAARARPAIALLDEKGQLKKNDVVIEKKRDPI